MNMIRAIQHTAIIYKFKVFNDSIVLCNKLYVKQRNFFGWFTLEVISLDWSTVGMEYPFWAGECPWKMQASIFLNMWHAGGPLCVKRVLGISMMQV